MYLDKALLTPDHLGPLVVRSPNIEAVSVLQERIPSIPLGNFDLTTSHQNDVLFNM
jgi:hypothetical protein